MQRLCIYVTYDSENIVDDYIGYMLNDLHTVADRIVAVCNYSHISQGMENIEPYADTIIYRENQGFDGGAYKEALEQIVDRENYEELILSNDTFFGPFIPLEAIFQKMEGELCDFWGLNRRHIPMYDFIASFFMVFKKPAISTVVRYIMDSIYKDISRNDILTVFEQGISNMLKSKGFCMGTFCDIAAVDMYRDPDYLICTLGSPVMKKRCFEKGYYVEENCRRALRYIEEKTAYDTTLIKKTVERKYGIVFEKGYTDINFIESDKDRGVYYSAPEEELENFLKENPDIYLYGNGQTAKDFERLYGSRVNILGHIVSKGFEENGVEAISRIKDKDISVVVALSKENSKEVSRVMQEFANVFYLWRWTE